MKTANSSSTNSGISTASTGLLPSDATSESFSAETNAASEPQADTSATRSSACTTTATTSRAVVVCELDHGEGPFVLTSTTTTTINSGSSLGGDGDTPSMTGTDFSPDHSFRSTCASSVASEGRSRSGRRSSQKSPAHILRSPSSGWKTMNLKAINAKPSTATSTDTCTALSQSCRGRMQMQMHNSSTSLSGESFHSTNRRSSTGAPPAPGSRAPLRRSTSSTARVEALKLAAMMQCQEDQPQDHQEENKPSSSSSSTFAKNMEFLSESIAQSTFMKNMDFIFGGGGRDN